MCDCYIVWRSIVTILFYLLALISDIVNGVFFIQRGEIIWGIATLVFMFLPAIFNLMLAVYGYSSCIIDSHTDDEYDSMLLSIPWLRRNSNWKSRWMHYCLILLRIEPIYSQAKLIQLVLRKSREKHDFEFKTMAEMFLEICLQSLPQLILQVYILGKESTVSGIQIVCIILSLSKMWYVLSSIDFRRGKFRCQKKCWWWFVKILWCTFGGTPFLISVFPSISLFASAYSSIYLLIHIPAICLFLIKWFWWKDSTKRRFDDCKGRTIYAFIVAILKTVFVLLIVMWYIRVKRFQVSSYDSPLIKKAIPPGIWPDSSTCLYSWTSQAGDDISPPNWAVCDRSNMYRNGTFAIDTGRWSAADSITNNISAFLMEPNLFCLIDIADVIFVLVFYCILISFFWDICYYFIRAFVDPDKSEESKYIIYRTRHITEERMRLKSNDGNDNGEINSENHTAQYMA